MKSIPQLLKENIRLQALIALAISVFSNPVNAQTPDRETKPRIVITADPELDDNNSMIRFYCTAAI